MRLLITDEVINEVSFDTIVMTALEFNDICSHPFIASTGFDEIIIDIRCKLNVNYLQPILKSSKVIPKVVGEITMQGVSILSEIYRDRAAELRVLFIRDKEKFSDLINQMKAQYRWEEFY